jgi:hypothetical protein
VHDAKAALVDLSYGKRPRLLPRTNRREKVLRNDRKAPTSPHLRRVQHHLDSRTDTPWHASSSPLSQHRSVAQLPRRNNKSIRLPAKTCASSAALYSPLIWKSCPWSASSMPTCDGQACASHCEGTSPRITNEHANAARQAQRLLICYIVCSLRAPRQPFGTFTWLLLHALAASGQIRFVSCTVIFGVFTTSWGCTNAVAAHLPCF